MTSDRTVLIVGASTGIGRGLASVWLERGWRVIGTVRDDKGEAALRDLPGAERLTVLRLDVADDDRQEAIAEAIERPLDVLMLNAGVFGGPDLMSGSADEALEVYRVNALGPARLGWRLRDKVREGTGVIAFTSTGMGSIEDNSSGGYDAYRASKAAQNMLARNLWHGVRARGVTVLSIDPGWVKTAMGGPNASINVDTSANGIVDQINQRSGDGDHQFITWSGKRRTW